MLAHQFKQSGKFVCHFALRKVIGADYNAARAQHAWE